MIQNDRLLRVLSGKAVDQTPVWLMRQAGRYLPEYRELREQAGSFWALCKTPDFAAEAAMQPIRRFDLDAAILFSDILTIPDAMGLDIQFIEKQGPVFSKPLHNQSDINALPQADMAKLAYVFDAIKTTKKRLDNQIPLIGFSGSPYTLACYMTEGQSSRDFLKIRRLIATDPTLARQLLEKISQSIIDYLTEQVKAGADILMIFDTWGGLLDPDSYLHFSLHYLKHIVDGVKKVVDVPILLYAKGAHQHAVSIANARLDGIGIDWTADLASIRHMLSDNRICLQGNLDPALLAASKETIYDKVHQMMTSVDLSRHIANLGHGIYPDTPPEGVQHFVDAVRRFSSARFSGQSF